MHASQYGLRTKHSTIHAVTESTVNIIKSIENGESVINVYLDLSKAFDTKNPIILLQKLEFDGITGGGGPLKPFQSYLSKRKQYVQYNDIQSNQYNLQCGVPQGSVLGSLLFLFMVICIYLFRTLGTANTSTSGKKRKRKTYVHALYSSAYRY